MTLPFKAKFLNSSSNDSALRAGSSEPIDFSGSMPASWGRANRRGAPRALIVGFHLGFFKNISREAPMRFGTHSLVATAVLSVAFAAYSAGAAAQAALAGKVSSAEEGAMEGVLVSAKRASSTITITVVSDAKGQYSFPAAKLEA